MKRTRRRIIRNGVVRLTTVFCIVALVAILSGTTDYSNGQTRQARYVGNPLVKLGEFAPDFELPRLTFKTDATGKPIGVISENDTVRLSSFRGKKPVCLIMSSYT